MKARIVASCALAAILAGCVIYTFVDLGPWDFESATTVANPFSTSVDNPWVVQNYGGRDSSPCLKSATLWTMGETSTLTLTYEGGLDDDKDLSFYLRINGSGSIALRINGFLEESYDNSGYGYYSTITKVNVYDSSNYKASGTNVLTWTFTCTDDYTDAYAILDEIEIDG